MIRTEINSDLIRPIILDHTSYKIKEAVKKMIKGLRSVRIFQNSQVRKLIFLKILKNLKIGGAVGLPTWKHPKTIKSFQGYPPRNNLQVSCLLSTLRRFQCMHDFESVLNFSYIQVLWPRNERKLAKLLHFPNKRMKVIRNLMLPSKLPSFLLQIACLNHLRFLGLWLHLAEDDNNSRIIFEKFCFSTTRLVSLEQTRLKLNLLTSNGNKFLEELLPLIRKIAHLHSLHLTQQSENQPLPLLNSPNLDQLRGFTSFFVKGNELKEFVLNFSDAFEYSILTMLRVSELRELESFEFQLGVAPDFNDSHLSGLLFELNQCRNLRKVVFKFEKSSFLTDDAVKQICYALSEMTNLYAFHLVLGNVYHGSDGLPNLPVYQRFTSRSVEHLTSFLRSYKYQLKELSVGFCLEDFNDGLFESLLDSIAGTSTLKFLQIYLFKAKITNSAFTHLKNCITNLLGLRTVDLALKLCLNITNELIMNLCELLTVRNLCRSLTQVKLNLEGTHVTHKALEDFTFLMRYHKPSTSFHYFLSSSSYSYL